MDIQAPGFVTYKGYDIEMALQSVGKGWAELIEVAFAFKPEQTKIVQVKEKFGGLRIYTDGTTKEYRELLNILEGTSYRRCEVCGKKGTLDTRYGWALTLCTQDKRKRKREMDAKRNIQV